MLGGYETPPPPNKIKLGVVKHHLNKKTLEENIVCLLMSLDFMN